VPRVEGDVEGVLGKGAKIRVKFAKLECHAAGTRGATWLGFLALRGWDKVFRASGACGVENGAAAVP
jgi:hypothetical protein